ncbi:hypothetical protein OB905_10105 [Halobacteria archaeon AArc-dxtr1]|nr:hypothetical protein [Halobacteria archaeon AArc-dxtr1]
MTTIPELRYYARELRRRLEHYYRKRRYGFRDRGTLDRAAAEIVAERARGGFVSGGHFRGTWPRDLCFAARGVAAAGYESALRNTADRLVYRLEDVFYTDVHRKFGAAIPEEGVDTFPALVVLLSECGALSTHAGEVTRLAALFRERFFDEKLEIVTGSGSSWWDSAAAPREAYNTAMLLAAIGRLERHDVETTFTDEFERTRDAWLSTLWTGSHFAERRGSATLACDANVVPLYFGLLDDDRAARVVDALSALETPAGLRMRARQFSRREVHPFFALHPDYHYHVWPWNSLMYANGLRRYGFDDRARAEIARMERLLAPYGNFLEVLTTAGEPYVKRGYASAEDFTVAAALWLEYQAISGSTDRNVDI